MTRSQEDGEIFAVARNLRDKVANVDELAGRAVSEGWTLDQFREKCLTKLPACKPIERSVLHDVPQREWRNYSLIDALNDRADGRDITGFAREMSDEIALKTGRKSEGFWLPNEAFNRGFVAGTGTMGGMVVETANMGAEFIPMLRNKCQVLNLGAKVLNLSSPATIPKQVAAGSANWYAETAATTIDVGNFQAITLTPKSVSSFQQYSKVLLATSNPSIDLLIREDMAQQLALSIDLAALHGTGTTQPLGIAGTTGINTVAISANGLTLPNATLFPFLCSLESSIAADNADQGSLAYLMRPGHRAACKTTPKWASTGTPIWETLKNPDGSISSLVNSHRVEVSNQISTALTTGTETTNTSCIFFGDWSALIVAQFMGGATDICVDPFSLAVNRVIRIIATKMVDVGVRTPESFCVGGGSLTH